MDDKEIFEVDLVEEFAFAAKKFLYADGGPVICYDCEAVLEYLEEQGYEEEAAIDYMDEQMVGSRFVWLHDLDLDVSFSPKPHLTLVH
jgi:hypothetical protein